MSTIQRFSSRSQRLDKEFLAKRLEGAVSYRRIAGYFRSSIFELVGEEIANIPDVRIVCNSELDVSDIKVSQAARESALKEVWNETSPAIEALLYRDQYRKLYALLRAGNVKIRVVPKNCVFLHGKAGVIEQADGSMTSFMGSINESKSAFLTNYEILWEDSSPAAVAWVDAEFDALWNDSYDLPDAIIDEVGRIAKRYEVRFEELKSNEIPGAALVESPLYRAGEMLQPWQRSFVSIFMQHRETYGKARLLLADEVGVGKTLSMAVSAMVSALMGDGKVLILCPSTLTFQWQTELKDRLGIPSAVWLSSKKCWQDENGHIIKNTLGAAGIKRCPSAMAIVSQGLIFHKADECAELLSIQFGTVILDEGHKARVSRGIGKKDYKPNNLLSFMLQLAKKTKNMVIGTATPIQTEVVELWDLLNLLNEGAGFVMGREFSSKWRNCDEALPVVKGVTTFDDPAVVWDYLRTPLPPRTETDDRIVSLRHNLDVDDNQHHSDLPFSELESKNFFLPMTLAEITQDKSFFKNNNPILRHTVLRRRDVLEHMGLLEKVAVDVHPDPKAPAGTYPGLHLDGLGLVTNLPFDIAYQAALDFTKLLLKRTPAAGFMKNMLLQRICSSFASGRATAQTMLDNRSIEDEEALEGLDNPLDGLSQGEADCLRTIVAELSRPEARDPKLAAVNYFLSEHRTGLGPDRRTFLEHGCIVFSQYYDTAKWVAAELAKVHPDIVVAVYAGTGKSGLFRGENFSTVEREYIKAAIKRHEIKLVVATDAACEGLNLQALGSLINIDLPWNPSRLEQRLGRIKRFGQARRIVDMLNLVYAQTRDERVYEVLSKRLKDKFDLFGSLPDTIDDDWIENVEELGAELDKYIEKRKAAKNAFEIRYQGGDTIHPSKDRWELCERVLARQELVAKLSEGW
ncbi:phospholipase D-like domain-containing anti-phage protein [Glaciimonas sp. GG7]